jgi:hypothetical protein
VSKPWSEMNTYERSTFIAEKLMGAYHDPRFPGDVVGYWVFPNGDRLIGGETPDYADDYSAARQVEDEIERRKLETEYLQALRDIACKYKVVSEEGTWWALIRATPEHRCRAALKAAGIEVA